MKNVVFFFLSLLFVNTISAQLWIEQTTNVTDPLIQTAFVDSLHGWANPSYYHVTSNFYLIVTKNGGKNWNRINYLPQNEQFREIQFIDSLIGYARGHSKIYKTVDGGVTWIVIFEAYPPSNQYSPSSTSIFFVDKDFGIATYYLRAFKTTDGGKNWSVIFNDPDGQTNKVYFLNNTHGWLTGNWGNILYRTTDGGSSWTKLSDNFLPLYFSDELNGYGTMTKNYQGIYRSIDGGVIWNMKFDGYFSDSPRYLFKGNIGLVSPDKSGDIYRTIDNGITWQSITNNIINFSVQSLAFTDENNIWLGGSNGKIFKLNLEQVIELKSLLNMETLFVGDEVDIVWSAYNIPTNDICKIEYTQNNGISWNTIADSVKTMIGKYRWKLGNTLVTSTTCKVRITSYSTNISTQNVNFFSIYITGHIIVAKIPYKPFYPSDSSLLITWNADYISNSKITVEIWTTPDTLNTQPSQYNPYAYDNTANLSDGQKVITVPYVTRYCKVRVKDSNSPLIFGETNYFKSRQSPKLTFYSPYSRHIWPADSIRQVAFENINIRCVDVSFSPDSGSTWIKTNSLVIEDSIGYHVTNFGWKVPRIESDHCMLKFESTDPIGVAPSISNIFAITQNLNFGVFPLSPNNKWFYKTSGGRYSGLYEPGTSYSYPNIYYIIVTGEEKLLDDSKKYYPFDIYRWDSYSTDFKKFIYIGTKYYRKSGNQIFTYENANSWFDFEYPFDKKQVFGIERRTFVNGDYGSYWDLIADGIGIIQPFSFSQNVRSGEYQTNNIAGAIIDGVTYGEVLTDFITSIDEINIQLPEKFTLSQNYPNPFNPTTTIKFSVPFVETRHGASLHVSLKVYDVLGREIATLVNEEKQPGNFEVKFDGSNFSSGVYFYRLQSGSFSETKKFVLMK